MHRTDLPGTTGAVRSCFTFSHGSSLEASVQTRQPLLRVNVLTASCFRVMTLTTSKQDIPPAEIPLQCSDKAEKSSDVAQLPQNPLSSYGYQSQSSPRLIAPFVLAHDIPRGVMHAVQALLGYTLMLAVMCVLPSQR
jgi:hypothetical protein